MKKNTLQASAVVELHLIDRASQVHVRLVTESATDKWTECQVQPKPTSCNASTSTRQEREIYVKQKQTLMQARRNGWSRVFY